LLASELIAKLGISLIPRVFLVNAFLTFGLERYTE
jgi:hypothetical protein